MRQSACIEVSRVVLPGFLLVPLLLAAAPAGAAELRVHYRALEKLMVAKAFTDEGRRYLQGTLDSPCRYAYVESPKVSSAAGRLRVAMQFSTRMGVEVAGNCVGAADAFPVTVSGVPVYRDGVLSLDQMEVETEGRGYGDLVRPFLGTFMSEGLSFPLQQRIEESSQVVWEETGARMSVPSLEIGEIRLGENELKVEFDFRVAFR